jgi:site-specific DNA recombinase
MIGCYARVSTQEQALNGHSIDEQKERMKKYADAMGWVIYDLYVDAGFTGANTDRPSLQRLIRDVKSHRIDKVLVYKLDRLSRSQKDTLMLIEDIFLANGCDFVSMNERFDTSTPFGRAMIGILAVFAQLEREQIKERMSMGKQARAKQGKFGGSNHVPIGYDYINGSLETNDFEKMQIIEIFNSYLAGKSPKKIASDLNERGLRHKFGAWREKTVRDILEKKTYLGYIAFNGEWYKGDHEPFISADIFEDVQSLIKKKRADALKYNRRAGKATSYLGGFLCCGQCGAKYGKEKSRSHGHEYFYYSCYSRTHKGTYLAHGECKNKTWRMEQLDSIIFDEIKKLSLESVESGPDQTGPEPINDQIDRIDSQISKLMDLFSRDGMPLDILEDKIHALNDQRQRLVSDLDRRDRLSPSDAMEIIDSFSDILDKGDFDEIRAVIGALIDKIEINGDDISIYWTFAH